MLLVVTFGAVLLLDGVAGASRTRSDENARTIRALAEAKAQLLAYALTDANRPGELPCPDTDRDGIAELLAGFDCPSLRGWLPRRTLNMISSRDGSGATLWYAVSDSFHAGGNTLLNPDTVGGVSVDGTAAGDIVAVIVAPGEALGNQTRPGAGFDAATHVGEYLEGGNADADLTAFVSGGGVNFNDRITYITAIELLRATERRVLGEVAAALTRYRQVNGAYPWLSPFADPASGVATLFDGVPGVRFGHLPYVEAADIGETQDTGYTITWTEGDAPVTTVGTDSAADNSPPVGSFVVDGADFALMQTNARAQITAGNATFPTPTAPTGGNPSCDWRGSVTVADCVGSVLAQDPMYTVDVRFVVPPSVSILFADRPVARDYTFDVSYSGTATVGPQSAGAGHAVRNVDSGATFQAFPAGSVSTITIRDYVVGLPGISVTRQLTIADGNTATLDIEDVYLEPSTTESFAGDLPSWFFDQEWERFVLVEYSGNALPGESLVAGTPCAPGTECVNLNIRDAAGAVSATRSDLNALVIGAGSQISGSPACQNRYSVPASPPCVASPVSLTDFFELTNAVATDQFAERRMFSSAWQFNDQVRIVDPGPLP